MPTALAVLAMLFSMVSAPALASTVVACLDAVGDWQDRIAVCTQAIESGDLSRDLLSAAYRERGRVYAEDGKNDAALEDFTMAIFFNLSYGAIENRVLRGMLYLDLGRLDDAEREFKIALLMSNQLNEQDQNLHVLAALQGCVDVLIARGSSDSRASLREQCDQAPKNTLVSHVKRSGPPVRDLISRMHDGYADEDWFAVAVFFSRAAQLDYDAMTCEWGINWGFEGYMLRQHDMLVRPEAYVGGPVPRTMAEIIAALEEDPRDPVALRERGLLFAASGGALMAVDDFDAALEAEPGSLDLMVMAAKAPIDALKNVNASDRYHNVPRSDLMPDLILEQIERAMALGADDFLTRFTYAQALRLHFYEVDNQSAIEQQAVALERAWELYPTWPSHPLKHYLGWRLNTHRAEMLGRAGDEEEAIKAWDLVMYLPPEADATLLYETCFAP